MKLEKRGGLGDSRYKNRGGDAAASNWLVFQNRLPY